MSAPAFFTPEARKRVEQAIRDVEATTSAELVVALRPRADAYRDVAHLVGVAGAAISLLLLLFLPNEFALWAIPIDVAIGYGVGALLAWQLWPLQRALVSRRRMHERVHGEACVAFVRLGVSRTTGRNGILVFASLFERRAEVIADVGLDVAALGEPWLRAREALDRAVAARDLDAFDAALRALGEVVAKAMPRRDDDVNELPDTVEAS